MLCIREIVLFCSPVTATHKILGWARLSLQIWLISHIKTFYFDAVMLLVGQQEGHLCVRQLGVSLLMVMVW